MVLSWLERNLLTGRGRIRWKGIYLLAELANIVDDIQSKPACVAIKRSLEGFKNEREKTGEPFVDPDWSQRKAGLRLYGLEQVMKSIPSSLLLNRGVHDWKDEIPLLSLYPQYSLTYRLLTNLQRFALFYQSPVRLFVDDAPCFSESLSKTLLIRRAHLLEVCRKW